MTMDLAEVLAADKITMTWQDTNPPSWSDQWEGASWYECKLSRDNTPSMTVAFGLGSGRSDEVPEISEVMEGLLSDVTFTDGNSFEVGASYKDWLADYDYPNDAKHRTMWRDGQKQTAKLKRFLGNDYGMYLEAYANG